jgi:hypothetical protein
MVLKYCTATAFPVAIGLMTTEAVACLATKYPEQIVRRHEPRLAHHVLQRDFVRPNNDPHYIGWSRSPGGWVYFGPQYTFVTGRGIIDEACNLPTSACPNTQRDGQ